MLIDLPSSPQLWMPTKPAIIRAWKREDTRLGAFPLMPIVPPMSAGGVTTLSLFATALGASQTPGPAARATVPPSVLAGDLIFVVETATVATVVGAPAGYTSLRTINATTELVLSYKIAIGTESGTSPNGITGGSNNYSMIAVFRGDAPVTTAVQGGSTQAIGAGSLPAPMSIAAGAGVAPQVVMAAYGCNNGTTGLSLSTGADGTISLNAGTIQPSLLMAWDIQNVSPANVTASPTGATAGTYQLVGGYVRCS